MTFKSFKYLAIALLSTMVSCGIDEDLSSCDSTLNIYFTFTKNPEGIDKFSKEVNSVELYIFDRDSIISDIVTITPDKLINGYAKVAVAPGTYSQIVAFGSDMSGVWQQGFEAGATTDPSTHSYSPLVAGKTHAREFRAYLSDVVESTEPVQGIAPMDANLSELFWAIYSTEFTIDIMETRRVDMDFLMVNNYVDVNITGLDNVGITEANAPKVLITASNGSYDSGYEICNFDRTVTYSPYSVEFPSATSQTSILNTLKVDFARHSTLSSPMMLYIKKSDGVSDLITPINLIDLIKEIKTPDGVLKYTTQDDLDREDYYSIDLAISKGGGENITLDVTLSINGYEIVELKPELM